MYKRTSESITTKKIISHMNLKFIFIYLKFIFEFSKNTKYEKDMVNQRLTIMSKNYNIRGYLSEIQFNNDFYFYYEVINTVINCIYISEENLNLLKNLKNIILQKKITFKLKKK
jgi:hypothetical protein